MRQNVQKIQRNLTETPNLQFYKKTCPILPPCAVLLNRTTQGGNLFEKRVVSFVLAVALAVGATLCSAAAADIEKRAIQIRPALTFNGTNATCEVLVVSGTDDLDVTMTLKRGNTVLDKWSESGTGYVLMTEHYTVIKGVTYTLEVSGTRNGEPFEAQPISRTC